MVDEPDAKESGESRSNSEKKGYYIPADLKRSLEAAATNGRSVDFVVEEAILQAPKTLATWDWPRRNRRDMTSLSIRIPENASEKINRLADRRKNYAKKQNKRGARWHPTHGMKSAVVEEAIAYHLGMTRRRDWGLQPSAATGYHPPTEPKDLHIKVKDDGALRLKWEHSEGAAFYEVVEVGVVKPLSAECDVDYVDLDELSPGEYEYRVHAVNGTKRSPNRSKSPASLNVTIPLPSSAVNGVGVGKITGGIHESPPTDKEGAEVSDGDAPSNGEEQQGENGS